MYPNSVLGREKAKVHRRKHACNNNIISHIAQIELIFSLCYIGI